METGNLIDDSLERAAFSNDEQAVTDEVLAILETVDPMENALEHISPFLSPDIVTSVIEEQQNQRLGFRFFIWATKRKSLRSWASHNLVIDKLFNENVFELFWKTLEELKISRVPITSYPFAVLIAAYAKFGMATQAVESFGRMKEFDCKPDVFTYNSILYVMVKKEVLLLALAVYNMMLKSNCGPSCSTYGILIQGLCSTGKLRDALQLVDEMTQRGISPDKVTYTIILSGLCQANRTTDAKRLLGTMKSSGCCPDSITYDALVNGFCKLGKIDEALMLLESFKNEGYCVGLKGYSSLIDGLFKASRFYEAHQMYNKLLGENFTPDLMLYTIMIRGLCGDGKVKVAIKLFKEMSERGVEPDTQCYNTLIKGFCDMGMLDEASSLKLEISKDGHFPDAHTYTILISSVCRKGLIMEAREIFNEMEKVGCFPSVVTFNALIHELCKAGDLQEARLLFHKMEIGRHPSLFLRLSQGINRVIDSVTLQKMVERLCESGLIIKAYKILVQLADSGVLPNITTYNILINGFCKAKNIGAAFKLFKDLHLKGLYPDSVTYGTLMDGLQRVGREDDAFGIFDQMVKSGCIPTSSNYKTLMTWSCRRGKTSLSFSLWLKYLRTLPSCEEEGIKLVEEHFDKGEVEEAIRGLLEMDLKVKEFDLSPYTIWLIGFCESGRTKEALKIFSILEELKISITAPSCVKLIACLCKEGNLHMAIYIFMHSLEKGTILMPRICNNLICSLLSSKDKVKHGLALVGRMKNAGYDLDLYLNRRNKFLLHRHWEKQETKMCDQGK